ncbi:MAG: hypothetical protein V4675_23675 [Verrucomicrobiota bacterium]
MKSILGFLLFLPFWGGAFAGLQTPTPTNDEVQFELNSRRAVPLKDGTERKLILEQMKPRVFPPPPAVVPRAPVDPVVRAAADQGLGIGFRPIHQAGQPAYHFPQP